MLEVDSRIAIIGAGISGVTAAHLLQRRYRVTLFESQAHIGGHAHTVQVSDPTLGEVGVDVGFIVLNDKTYPNFQRLLSELGIAPRYTDMSFGYESEGWTYAGRTLSSLFADRRNLLRPKFYRFILELKRFCDIGVRELERGVFEQSLGEFIAEHRFSTDLVQHYLLPMGGAIWSTSDDGVLNYPAHAFLSFFKNHGLLSLRDRPRWQTIPGGSRTYLKRFQETFRGEIRLSTPVRSIERSSGKPKLTFDGGAESFDAVVCATHAPLTLSMLQSPTEDEARVLGAWTYTSNSIALHTDERFLPRNRRAWASWNVLRGAHSAPTISYWMNNLQHIASAKTYAVTLNRNPDSSQLIYSTQFEHPAYTKQSIASQRDLSTLQGVQRTYFAGAYHGYGFHEDGCRSGVQVANLLGVQW